MSMVVDEAMASQHPMAKERATREEMRERVWEMFTAPHTASGENPEAADQRMRAEAEALSANLPEATGYQAGPGIGLG